MSTHASADPDNETRNILVRPVANTISADSPRHKPAPKSGSNGLGLKFWYNASDDGTDENLVILLHGLGDTHGPFGKLGKSLKLPQTATLALQAPQQIPYLYEDAFQWYPSFDELGEFIKDPNPSVGVEAVLGAIEYMISECTWPANRIHLFGFAQGGSVALEVGLRWWRKNGTGLKSIVSVGGGLVSYPTMKEKADTRVLLMKDDGRQVGRGYENIKQVTLSHSSMPNNKDEWGHVMEFWSEVLEKRVDGDLYQVL
ncbi:hypothetical protein FRC03_009878 [Tulasnella sp. 419]|nr:hypothetical protein FRC03_009878 [Tulasnella sp. 419]